MIKPTSPIAGAAVLALLFAALLVGSCSRKDAGAGADQAPAEAVAAAISAPPWLHQRLPADTIAYVRIPSPWGLLSAPNDKAADAMFASAAHVRVISELRARIDSHPIFATVLGSDDVDRTLQALNSLAGPVELAVIAPGGIATTATQVLLSTVLSDRDSERVSAHLGLLLGPGGGSQQPELDKNGYGMLQAGDMGALPMHFDRASGRLHVLGGMSPDAAQLERILADVNAAQTRTHALHTLEAEIDAGGQGLLLWLDVQSVKPWLMASLAGGQLWLRHVYEQTEAVAFGWGGVEGHGRLSFRAQLRDPTWLRYLPQAPRSLDLASSGAPGFVVSLALPTVDDLDRILDAVAADHGPGVRGEWQKLDEMVQSLSGATLRDWIAPFGPELVLFNDNAGFHTAMRLRDRAALQRLIELVVGNGGSHRSREFGGQRIEHLSYRITAPFDGVDAAAAAGMAPLALLSWWQGLPEHLYWIEDGSWMLTAGVPQPLIDRIGLGTDQGLDAWLQASQGSDRSAALLSVSARTRHLSRWYYHGYLSLLAHLGDILNQPVDLFDLPSARQLGLPQETGLGLQIIADGERLALDLNYEHVAADGLFAVGGGYTAIASAGILAAIALPAYQDYTVRARTMQGLSAAAPLRLAIAEGYQMQGRLPAAGEIAEVLETQPANEFADVLYEGGAIRIRFNDRAGEELDGRNLYLHPYRGFDGQVHFVCGSAQPPADATALLPDAAPGFTTVSERHLPGQCRP